MTIADRIKQKRLEKDLSQTELALRAGYNNKTAISKLEHSGDNISMKQINKIASALGISPAYLMGWEDSIVKYVDNSYEISDPYFADSEEVNKAKELYELYEKATPDVQQAVELILKSSQQKS